MDTLTTNPTLEHLLSLPAGTRVRMTTQEGADVIGVMLRATTVRVGERMALSALVWGPHGAPIGNPRVKEHTALPENVEVLSRPSEEVCQIAKGMHALYATAESERRSREAGQAFLDDLVKEAHTYADQNELCTEFDRFMDDHGLPQREDDYTVMVDVEVTLTFEVERTLGRLDAENYEIDEDDARELVEEALDTSACHSYNVDRVHTENVTPS